MLEKKRVQTKELEDKVGEVSQKQIKKVENKKRQVSELQHATKRHFRKNGGRSNYQKNIKKFHPPKLKKRLK